MTEFLKENYETGKMIDLKLFYKSGKEYYPVRICAVGKNEADIEKTHKHTKNPTQRNNEVKSLICKKYTVNM